jgi:MFS family permease
LESVGSLGFFLGPLMASSLYTWDGHYLPFLVLAVISSVIFIVLIFKVPKDK